MKTPKAVFSLYTPLVAIVILINILLTLEVNDQSSKVVLNFFSFISTDFPIPDIMAARIIIATAIVSSFFTYFFIDYSQLFPSRVKMEVFFDLKGLQTHLSQYSKKELYERNIHISDIEKYQQVYINDIVDALRESLPTITYFNVKEVILRSFGSASFIVQKTSSGIQTYHLEESEGEITSILEEPNKEPLEYRSFFEKIHSGYDYITPSMIRIFFNKIIVSPKYKQILANKYRRDGVLFHHTLLGVAQLRIFPFPCFESALYFYEFKDVGLIPIAYAVFEKTK